MSEEDKIKRGLGRNALTGFGALRDPAKRKFNITKVAGSATNLQLIMDDNRWFEDQPLL